MTLNQRVEAEVMCNHCGERTVCAGGRLADGWLAAAFAFGRVDVSSPGAGIVDASGGGPPVGTLHYCPLSAAQLAKTLGLTVDGAHEQAFATAELSATGAVE